MVSSTHLGITTRFLLLSDSCRFVDMGRCFWRENGSAVYNCCWSSPAESFWVRVPRYSTPYFTVSNSRLPKPGGPGPRIYIPQEQGGPVLAPGPGFPFRRLLRLAGSRWRYSNPPPHGVCLSRPNCLYDNSSAQTTQKTQPLYCRDVFTVSLHSSGRGANRIEKTVLIFLCASYGRYLTIVAV
jgi:hypothetical protein